MLYEITEYESVTGRVHHLKGYYYDPDKIRLYKIIEDKLYEIPRRGSTFNVVNEKGHACALTWMKLDHIVLRNRCLI